MTFGGRLLTAAFGFLLLAASGAAQSPPDSPLPPIKTVFVVVEENQDWAGITNVAPYITGTLLPGAAHAEQYFNPPGLHPSEPNYIWLEAGSNLGITDSSEPSANHRNTSDHLVAYLDKAGISWKAYAEDIDGNSCPLTAVGNYVPRHNPFVYFDDVTNGNDPSSAYCIAHIRPYSELQADLQANTVARYNFIIPNLCNNGHDCGPARSDQWLSAEVPKILGSAAFQDGGVLFITWDEGTDVSDGPIGMIVLSPFAKVNYSNSINDGGIVNNASYNLVSTAVAQGSIAALFGTNLTDGRSCLPPRCGPAYSAQGLSTSLNGTTVLVNGAPAPLFYATPTQLGFQIPFELTGSSATVQVAANGRMSAAKTISLLPASPGIFTTSLDGRNRGVITHADGTQVTPERPASAGEMVTLFGTGFGPVSPAVATGMKAAGPAATVAPALVAIGGVTIIPDYAGLAGCCVGLNQINFRVPAGVHAAPDVPLSISIGAANSNTVTIAVQ
jgi:uncharacterized protein (TIGR03437 family)